MKQMILPSISIDRQKLLHNVKTIFNTCKKENINLVGITKGFCGNIDIAKIFIEAGISIIGDSRLENLEKINQANLQISEKLLIRLPMLSEAEDVVEIADISLNSEIDTIYALSIAAKKKRKLHKIILLLEQGDLREGALYEEIIDIYRESQKLEGIQIIGIGTNLTCLNGVIPTQETMLALVKLKSRLNSLCNNKISIISCGNSSAYYLIDRHQISEEVNQIRMGESLLMGINTSTREKISYLHQDVFKIHAEIIELKEKPSLPWGEINMDGFGNIPNFKDIGIRKRAILAIGCQDAHISSMHPIDSGIIIVGQNSDHTVLDVTDSAVTYHLGDIIEFQVEYRAMMAAFTSPYVHKHFL